MPSSEHPPLPACPRHTGTAAPLVLDTNAVLDWLVFDDPGMRALARAIEDQQVRWLACAPMREELAHMLGHHSLARWAPEPAIALARFDHWAVMLPTPPGAPRLRCTDADDQVFVDLALAHRARWLVSHDRALLKLGRRLRTHGVNAIRPADWAPPQT